MVGLHLSTLWTCRRLYVARGCFFYLRELCAVLLRTPNCICEARDRPQYLKKRMQNQSLSGQANTSGMGSNKIEQDQTGIWVWVKIGYPYNWMVNTR